MSHEAMIALDAPRKVIEFPDTPMTLMMRLRTESDEAWDRFYSIYGPLVYRVAEARELDHHAAEEVVSAVMQRFVRAVKNGFRVDHDVGLFRNYLRTVTYRQIVNLYRRSISEQAARSGHPQGLDFELTEDPVAAQRAAWLALERRGLWESCMQQLQDSPSVRERDYLAFEQYGIQGKPAKAVARRYGVTVNRLYGIKHEMVQRLKQLRANLDRDLEEGEP